MSLTGNMRANISAIQIKSTAALSTQHHNIINIIFFFYYVNTVLKEGEKKGESGRKEDKEEKDEVNKISTLSIYDSPCFLMLFIA